jgi:hypothetical protein
VPCHSLPNRMPGFHRAPLQLAIGETIRQIVAERPRRTGVQQSPTLRAAMQHQSSYLTTFDGVFTELIVNAASREEAERVIAKFAGAIETHGRAIAAAVHGRAPVDTLATFGEETAKQGPADVRQLQYIATRTEGDRRAARDAMAEHHRALGDAIHAIDTTGIVRGVRHREFRA